MGDRFENTAGVEIPELDDYARIVTKAGGTRRALISELAKKIVEEYEGSSLGGEERTIQAAIADAKQVASEAIQEEQTARQNADTAITADLAKKAYADGEYADLHAGTANQLLADTYTTDEEPYHYRTTPSNAGTREIDSIVGGSVVWNQLVNTSTSSVTVTSDHKYVAKISDAWSVGASAGTALSVTGGTDMVFDITQMFPSTIADHIYDLERANAGAGVEFFRKYFPEEYYAYDAGTMRSVEGLVSHDMVGKNLLDLSTFSMYKRENGVTFTVNSDGTVTVNGTATSLSQIYWIIPNKVAKEWGGLIISGSPGSSVSQRLEMTNSPWTLFANDTGSGATILNSISDVTDSSLSFFIRVYEGVTVRNAVVCPMIRRATANDTYEPYSKHSYPLDNSVTLRGIPQLIDGQLKFDGDTYSADGLVTRRYGIVDLGSLTWSYINQEGLERFLTTPINLLKGTADSSTALHAIANGYSSISYSTFTSQKPDQSMFGYPIGNANEKRIAIRDTRYTDADAFKASLSGKYLVYELATPTTEQAEPYQELQICSPYGTEEYVSTGIVPVGHYTKYPTDLKGIVEQIADAPSADGTYTLKAVVSGGKVTYSWQSES